MLHDRNDYSWMPIGDPSLRARLMIDGPAMIDLIELAWNAVESNLHTVAVAALGGRPLGDMLHAPGGRKLRKQGCKVLLFVEVADPLLASAVTLAVDGVRDDNPFKLSRIIGRFPSVETREHLYRLPCFADDLVTAHVGSVQGEDVRASRHLRFQTIGDRADGAWCAIEVLEQPLSAAEDTVADDQAADTFTPSP